MPSCSQCLSVYVCLTPRLLVFAFVSRRGLLEMEEKEEEKEEMKGERERVKRRDQKWLHISTR